MYIEYEPNPVRSGGIDCTVRALTKALDVSWERAYVLLALNGFLMGNMPSADEIWGSVLRQNGFVRKIIPDSCPNCYSVEEFCVDHPKGTHVVKSENHVATVVDGDLYDSWNSQGKTALYYWEKEN